MVLLSNLLAQVEKDIGFLEGLGPLGKNTASWSKSCGDAGYAACLFTNFISKAIGIMTVVAFIWFIFNLFIGAIGWLGSGGDKQKLQEAQKKITTNLTGLVIVISAIFLTKIISLIFGIDILNLTEFITKLGQ